MDRPLFVYGTLRDPDLLAAVLGRPLQAEAALPAVAPGFRTVNHPNRISPALIRAPGGAALGLVLLGLSRFECDLLDAFEGGDFRRGVVPVMIGEELHEVDAHLSTIAIAGGDPWTLERWQAVHKGEVWRADASRADAIRQKLIASRPN